MFRAVVEAERRSGGTTFRRLFRNRNGVPAIILQHRSAFRSLKVERVPPPLENVLSRIRFYKNLRLLKIFQSHCSRKCSVPDKVLEKFTTFEKFSELLNAFRHLSK